MTGQPSPSLTIACPLWNPVRDLGRPRDLWRGETKPPRAHKGGSPRVGSRSPRTSRDVCAEPLSLEGFWKPEAFPVLGLGPFTTERFGGWHW